MALATDPIAASGLAPTTAMTGSKIMCEALAAEGVEVLFGFPGGAIMPFYDALYTYPNLRHVLVRHEQAAAHAADGFARATGQVGVCVATSGPGATNLVTGLANALMDSVPMVAITGQVARPGIGKDSFQETDVIGVTMPVTKHNILVESVEDLGPAIHEAFAVARAGRPGPVLIDVPKDVQFEQTVYIPRRHDPPIDFRSGVFQERELRAAARLLDTAERPLILAGHGIILSHAYESLRRLAERTETPVATTLLGLSAFPESHPLALGMLGMHGHGWANRAINEADVIFAVGMRFDDRETGKIEEFAPQARIIHVDIEAAELEKVLPAAVPIQGDAGKVMDRLVTMVAPADHPAWLARIESWRRPATRPAGPLPQPVDIFACIKRASGGRATLVTDVGQHQMWAAQLYGYDLPNTHILVHSARTIRDVKQRPGGARIEPSPPRRVVMPALSMRAVRQHSFGGPEVLQVEDVSRPVALPTEVLVRVHAAGVNPVDWKTRSGSGMAAILGEPPLTVGWDVSGVVEKIGFGVTTLVVGDEVFGMPWFPRQAGAYAEYVTAPARQFARSLASPVM